MPAHAATVRATMLAVLLVTLAACGPVPPPTPPPEPTPPPASRPAAPPPIPDAQPPEAILSGLIEGDVAGDLGTFSWDGFVSDAPWLTGPAGGSTTSVRDLAVSFRPAPGDVTWHVEWVRLTGGRPGNTVMSTAPASGPIRFDAPAATGDWSVGLFARFGVGRDAAWFWHVEVAP